MKQRAALEMDFSHSLWDQGHPLVEVQSVTLTSTWCYGFAIENICWPFIGRQISIRERIMSRLAIPQQILTRSMSTQQSTYKVKCQFLMWGYFTKVNLSILSLSVSCQCSYFWMYRNNHRDSWRRSNQNKSNGQFNKPCCNEMGQPILLFLNCINENLFINTIKDALLEHHNIFSLQPVNMINAYGNRFFIASISLCSVVFSTLNNWLPIVNNFFVYILIYCTCGTESMPHNHMYM